MISAFANTWKVAELRERIIYTLVMIVVIRLGVHITMPGIDSTAVDEYIKEKAARGNEDQGNILNTMMTIFSGGGLQQMGLFALGIMPYISASILMQLMTAVVPKIARLSKEDGGRQKINQYTRFITVLIALVQGFFLARQLYFNPGSLPFFYGLDSNLEIVASGWSAFTFVSIFTLSVVTGTLFLMWIGDQMTENGIGNGTSMIITVNIISALPGALVALWNTLVTVNTGGALFAVFLFAFLIFVVAATIAITQAQRRIAIQYAKRVVGRKQYGGQTQYLPLKINYANVMPIIFATAILGIPTMLVTTIFKDQDWAIKMGNALAYTSIWYYVIAGAMIFFFSYFWVATMFNPSEISENLKKSGGYVPGIRPGQPTAKFLDFTMTRLTFAGAVFLSIIFFLPYIVSQLPMWTGIIEGPLNQQITGFFGGTSLLIMVGVILDMMRQIETHLLQRDYDGFLRKGKIKGRSNRKHGSGAKSSNSMVFLMTAVALLFILGIVAYSLKQS